MVLRDNRAAAVRHQPDRGQVIALQPVERSVHLAHARVRLRGLRAKQGSPDLAPLRRDLLVCAEVQRSQITIWAAADLLQPRAVRT